MTLPDERTRAVLWAGGFLIELARDERLPLEVRRRAVVIARHFPTVGDVSSIAKLTHPLTFDIGFCEPGEIHRDPRDFPFGPLIYSTRLEWPEDP